MKVKAIKIIVAGLVFIFVLLGHFYLTDFSVFLTQRKWIDTNLFTYIQDHFKNKNIFLGYSYAIAGAFASLCIFNLITTSGGIKQSIRGVTISAGLWGGICFVSGCCGSPMLAVYITLFGSHFAGLTKPITAGITTVSILLSFYYVMRFNNKNLIVNANDSIDVNNSNNPFATIKTYKPPIKIWSIIRFVLMTVFRLFPNPSSLGIYKFGNPDKMSPVLVTSNYVLTLERIAHVLKNIDCYLLVVDCKGINVWCAAGAGHFTVQSIIDGLKYSSIEKLVDHHRIILPQFCASGICRDELKEKTGWIPLFGPTYIKDIKTYLDNNYVKNKSLRSASFGLLQRIEMGIGSSLICVFGITCVMVFVNAQALGILIPLIYMQAVFFSVIQPYLPMKPGIITGSVYALFHLFLLFLIAVSLHLLQNTLFLSISIPLILSAFYLPNEFLGWSPLIKYNWQMIFRGDWKAKISVNTTSCIGCALCVSVCPMDVFSMYKEKSKVVKLQNCEGCKACFYQCPVNAIQHSLQSEKDSCSCLYCNIQKNLISE